MTDDGAGSPLRPFHGRERGPVRFAGVVYQFLPAEGAWQRFVLRRYADGRNYWSRTYPVDAERVFCLRCLSHNLALCVEDEFVWHQCLNAECGIRFRMIDDTPPPDDEL